MMIDSKSLKCLRILLVQQFFKDLWGTLQTIYEGKSSQVVFRGFRAESFGRGLCHHC